MMRVLDSNSFVHPSTFRNKKVLTLELDVENMQDAFASMNDIVLEQFIGKKLLMAIAEYQKSQQPVATDAEIKQQKEEENGTSEPGSNESTPTPVGSVGSVGTDADGDGNN